MIDGDEVWSLTRDAHIEIPVIEIEYYEQMNEDLLAKGVKEQGGIGWFEASCGIYTKLTKLSMLSKTFDMI